MTAAIDSGDLARRSRLEQQAKEPNARKKRNLFVISSMALRGIGLVCLAAGGISAALRAGCFSTSSTTISGSALLELLDDPDQFALATVTIFLQMMELCAIPIFSFLLTEGAEKTAHMSRYLLRVLGLAVLCEVPFAYLWYGRAFLATNHNIVFGALMALIMLWFFRTFPEKSAGNRFIRIFAVLGCFLWCNFLGLEHGAAMVLITCALWLSRGKPILQILAGFLACILCTVLSPMYLFSALGLLVVHLYGGAHGFYRRSLTYLAYPVILAVSCLIRALLSL